MGTMNAMKIAFSFQEKLKVEREGRELEKDNDKNHK